jgi:sec-independent protein translocase protein TatC
MFKKKDKTNTKTEMSFIEHLDELRKHIFRSVIALVIGALAIAYFNDIVIKKVLMGPTHADFPTYTYLCKLGHKLGFENTLCLEEIHVKMQSTVVTGQFSVFMNIVLIGGFIVAFPYIFWQFWLFVKPALKKNEMKKTSKVIFWVSFLFFTGVFFGYFVIAPYTIHFFANFTIDDNIENIWTLTSYFDTITPLILGSGIAFQLPLVLYFLAQIDIVSSNFLKKYRRHSILIIVILVSIITPPDMLSTIICSIPLVLLYEISILLCLKVEKNKSSKELQEWS